MSYIHSKLSGSTSAKGDEASKPPLGSLHLVAGGAGSVRLQVQLNGIGSELDRASKEFQHKCGWAQLGESDPVQTLRVGNEQLAGEIKRAMLTAREERIAILADDLRKLGQVPEKVLKEVRRDRAPARPIYSHHALWGAFLFWAGSIEGGTPPGDSRYKASTVERAIGWRDGELLETIEPITVVVPCPKCRGSLMVTSNTVTFTKVTRASLRCTACGHCATHASFVALTPWELPVDVLSCGCAPCQQTTQAWTSRAAERVRTGFAITQDSLAQWRLQTDTTALVADEGAQVTQMVGGVERAFWQAGPKNLLQALLAGSQSPEHERYGKCYLSPLSVASVLVRAGVLEVIADPAGISPGSLMSTWGAAAPDEDLALHDLESKSALELAQIYSRFATAPVHLDLSIEMRMARTLGQDMQAPTPELRPADWSDLAVAKPSVLANDGWWCELPRAQSQQLAERNDRSFGVTWALHLGLHGTAVPEMILVRQTKHDTLINSDGFAMHPLSIPDQVDAADCMRRLQAALIGNNSSEPNQAHWNCVLWAADRGRVVLGPDKALRRCTLGPARAPAGKWTFDGHLQQWHFSLTPVMGLLGQNIAGYLEDVTVGSTPEGWTERLQSHMRKLRAVQALAMPAFARRWNQQPWVAYLGLAPAEPIFVRKGTREPAQITIEQQVNSHDVSYRARIEWDTVKTGTTMVRREGYMELVPGVEDSHIDELSTRLARAERISPPTKVNASGSAYKWFELHSALVKEFKGANAKVTANPPLLPASGSLTIDLTRTAAKGHSVIGYEHEGTVYPLADVLRELDADPRFHARLAQGEIDEEEVWLVGLPIGIVPVPLRRLATIFAHLWELGGQQHRPNAASRVGLLPFAALSQSGHLRCLGLGAADDAFQVMVRNDWKRGVELIPQPLGLRLRPAQKEGVGWMYVRARARLGGLVADEMGTGKTLMNLAFICVEQAEQDGPASLVVAPKGVYEEWCKQMVKHGVELRCQSLQGVQDTPTVQSAAATNDLVFTTYKSVQLSRDSFSAVSWRGITLDEGHEIRNSRSQTTAALLSLRAEYRFALTGTPWNNSTGDLWPLYEFVAPGLLGPAEAFHRETCVELDENGSQWHCDRLRARISLFTIRRTRRGLGLIMDETPVQRILCVPSAAQWDLYEAERLRGVVELKEVFHRRGFKHSGVKVQNVLMRLRQVLSDPRLLGTAAAARVPSIKAEICRQLLTKHENAGDHTVICSPFSSVLDLIASDRRTDGLQVASITGSTSQDQRNAAREELDLGELPALMLSMKAGGVALNLQSANVYIQYDGWFNPSAEDQARMRVDRFGNSRPVTVYELVVPNSVEQRMDAIKARKRQIAEAIFGDAPAVATELKEQDVWDLLEPMTVPQKLKLAA